MQVVCEREDFIARTGARLYQSPIGFDAPRGDHDLNPEWSGTPNGRSYKRAAVLVPVIMRHDRLTIMLTHRGSALRAHSGQISFPGGKVDPGDPSLRATALREAQEEIGLDARFVELLGLIRTLIRSEPAGNLCDTRGWGLVARGASGLSVKTLSRFAEIFGSPGRHSCMNPENHEVQVAPLGKVGLRQVLMRCPPL